VCWLDKACPLQSGRCAPSAPFTHRRGDARSIRLHTLRAAPYNHTPPLSGRMRPPVWCARPRKPPVPIGKPHATDCEPPAYAFLRARRSECCANVGRSKREVLVDARRSLNVAAGPRTVANVRHVLPRKAPQIGEESLGCRGRCAPTVGGLSSMPSLSSLL
jgi:hypothetical protein